MKLGDPTVQTGSISGDVKTVQQILTGQGYNVGPIDGNFGPQTQQAVIAFQKSKGLLPDGIVGPQTWAALKGQAPEPVIVPMVPALPPPVQNASAPSDYKNIPLYIGLGCVGLAMVLNQKSR